MTYTLNGLMLSHEYYNACEPALREAFPVDFARFACGLAGDGSECFGFDDKISQDHDFGAGFCIWLTDEDFDTFGEELQRVYMSLPQHFRGYSARPVSVNGLQRVGAMRISDYYRKFTGLDRAPRTLGEWLRLPEHFVATAVNGEVFRDELGAFSAIRNELLAFYPEDIRLKKLSNRIATMAQSGQYNYPRSLRRGESVAALLSLAEFVKAACSAAYLINRKYMPFYKWAHKGLDGMPVLPELFAKLTALTDVTGTQVTGTQDISCKDDATRDSRETQRPQESTIQNRVEEICGLFAAELRACGLSDATDDYLMPHAEQILHRIKSEALRAMPVFAE